MNSKIKFKYNNLNLPYYHVKVLIKTKLENRFKKLPDHIDPCGKDKMWFAWDIEDEKAAKAKARYLSKLSDAIKVEIWK